MPRNAVRLALALAVVLGGMAAEVRAEVFISEICDPRLNYASDRFVEIYNPGPESIDLTGWQLVAVANSVDAFTWALSGSIQPGQALVAGDATTVTAFPVAFPAEAWSGANGNWNGRVGDGAKLISPLGVITDSMVATGTFFENADYVRKPGVGSPNPVTTPAEWTSTPVDLATDASPGTHVTSSPDAGPTIAAIHTDPAAPTPADAVHVLADVTDTTATIAAVTLEWGTAPASLTNAIAMAVLSDDTYRTVMPIPAQPGGTTVHYHVVAGNDLPATTTSPTQSYSLGHELTIRQIQGEAAASPYDGQIVSTHGVVTGVFGTTCVIQDGAGAWNGLWVRGSTVAARGDSVTATGRVTESDGTNAGNTMLVDAQVVAVAGGAALPAALPLATAGVGAEACEGVLVLVSAAACTDTDLGGGVWQADDGSGACRVGVLGYRAEPTLGTGYDVTGPVAYGGGSFRIEPRSAADVVWAGDLAAPVVLQAVPLSETTLRVLFSEPVESSSAAMASRYAIPGVAVSAAARELGHPDRVRLTVSPLAAGDHTLTVTGVADLFGNVTDGTGAAFTCYAREIPAGYYDAAAGLQGDPLKLALHEIIDDHTARSYDYAWTAYYTTDVRPDNGKVWDIYSDIPGGTPPYLYDFGIDQGGIGGAEGTGYTREHTWCKTWFGGEVSPMYSDLFALYPCDTHMNGTRGVYPYGETAAPLFVSLNGSKVGPSSVPGYTEAVFEPRDDFKGDLARVYFYFSTRYHTEDAAWPTGPATDGAALQPWALALYLKWNDEDPVGPKEIARNSAVYAIQGNRNPFVDRPEFVDLVFGSLMTGVDDGGAPGAAANAVFLPAAPNPFTGTARIAFALRARARVTLRVYDVRGAMIRVLLDEERDLGRHQAIWDGRDAAGRAQPAGVYFYRLLSGGAASTRKVLLVR